MLQMPLIMSLLSKLEFWRLDRGGEWNIILWTSLGKEEKKEGRGGEGLRICFSLNWYKMADDEDEHWM